MLESLFNKVEDLKTCNFIKKRLQHRCFPVKFCKFLRTFFFTEHLRWLLLEGFCELITEASERWPLRKIMKNRDC